MRPTWSNPRSRGLGIVAVASALLAIGVQLPVGIADIDDIALRIVFPASLAFVLAFAPLPSTHVGRIARDLTVLALSGAVWAGSAMPLLLACYPLVLVAAVVLGSLAKPETTVVR